MATFITVVHVILCILLMIFILLQSGKGAEMGAVFGGSSQTVFGSQGAATFLGKLTTYCAIGFMVTSLSLVYIGARETSDSIMDSPAATTDVKDAETGAAADPAEGDTSGVQAPATQPESGEGTATSPADGTKPVEATEKTPQDSSN